MKEKQIFTLKDSAGEERQFRLLREFSLNRTIYIAAMPYPDSGAGDEVLVSYFKLATDTEGERLEYVREVCEIQEVSECFRGLLGDGQK